MKVRILSLIFTVGLALSITTRATAQSDIPTSEQQMKAAVSAAPASMQSGAKVYGYDQQGRWTTLRAGSNELICIADNPQEPNFHVACYFSELEPFMKRGRELRDQGKSRKEVDDIRKKEIENGRLRMPEKPTALYNLSGPEDGFNYNTGTVEDAKPLYVVYIPYATQKSTGLTTSPMGPGAPWLMEPGLPWAHIMIPGNSKDTNPGR